MPDALANPAQLASLPSRPPELALQIFDYIDAMIAADRYLPPPGSLAHHAFRFYDWEHRASRSL